MPVLRIHAAGDVRANATQSKTRWIARRTAHGGRGLIGYAVRDSSGRLKLQKLKESLFEADVEISDDVFILKTDEAQKLREPPRLSRIVIRPDHVVVRSGERASFSYSGMDQYGQPHSVAEVEWTATGGSIDASGTYVADQHGGAFTVKAVTEGAEAVADIRVMSKGEQTTDPVIPSGPQTLQWSGAVPTQKWMQFYTKIVTRFATSPDLKIEVRFTVPVESEQMQAKVAEVKNGLRELGLDDNVIA